MNFIIYFLFFLVAVFFSMLGLGGGIFYMPLLIGAGINFHQAVATSLALIAIMSFTAAFIYHKDSKLIDWHIVFTLEPFTILGALCGSYNSRLFSPRQLEIFLAIIMFISAFLLILPLNDLSSIKPKKTFGVIHKKHSNGYYSINLWIGIPISFIAGIISSIIGIGGGFAKVPLMTIIFKTPIKIASATSSAMIVLTSLAGILGHSMIGNINIKLILPLSLIVITGGIIGSKIAIKIDKKILTYLLSFLEILLGFWLIFK